MDFWKIIQFTNQKSNIKHLLALYLLRRVTLAVYASSVNLVFNNLLSITLDRNMFKILANNFTNLGGIFS